MKNENLLIAEELYKSSDFEKCFNAYETLAKQGVEVAQHKTGKMLDEGIGVEQDLAKAAYWYEQAAKQGYLDSQFNLAELYVYGDGVKVSWDKAYYWYREAARKGDQGAQKKLDGLDKMSAPEDHADNTFGYLFIVDGIEFEDLNAAFYQILPNDTDAIQENLIRYLNQKWPDEARSAISLSTQEDYAYPQLSHYWDVLANERGCEYLADIYEYVLQK